MTFGENLQSLRDHAGMTQEALAEQLEVSRQSVSKWESGGSFPEMEKLLAICDIFRIDMDTLLRGDVMGTLSQDSIGYDKAQNWFSKMIAGGTFLILMAISIMFFSISVGIDETVAMAFLMMMIAVAVVLFIVAGMSHESFEKKHPHIIDFYTEEEKERNHKKSVAFLAGGVALVLLDVAWMLLFLERVDGKEVMELRLMGMFMLIMSLAVAGIIYGAMQSEKCKIDRWNHEHDQSPEQVALRKKVSTVCGCIMLLATAIYLAIGFGDMALGLDYGNRVGWAFGWIVFPVGGVLCGVASTIIRRNDPDEF